MNNAKQDNWRQKLLDLDSLPGETIYNKEAAWCRLQHRLQPPIRRKKAHWYWAAAAMLLLLGVPWLIKRSTTLHPKENIAGQPISKPVIPGLPSKKEPAGWVIESAPVAKKTVAQKTRKHTAQPVNTQEYRTAQILNAGNDTIVTVAIIPRPDSTTVTLATAKPERKLQVIHINDLETPAAGLALSTEPSHSRWRTKRSQRLPANQLAATQAAGDGIIHIKLPFKN